MIRIIVAASIVLAFFSCKKEREQVLYSEDFDIIDFVPVRKFDNKPAKNYFLVEKDEKGDISSLIYFAESDTFQGNVLYKDNKKIIVINRIDSSCAKANVINEVFVSDRGSCIRYTLRKYYDSDSIYLYSVDTISKEQKLTRRYFKRSTGNHLIFKNIKSFLSIIGDEVIKFHFWSFKKEYTFVNKGGKTVWLETLYDNVEVPQIPLVLDITDASPPFLYVLLKGRYNCPGIVEYAFLNG